MRRSIRNILAAAAVCVMSLSAVPVQAAQVGSPAADSQGQGLPASEIPEPVPTYAQSIEDASVQYAPGQIIVAVDDAMSRSAIKREIRPVGSVSDITVTDEQKLVLVDLTTDDLEAAQILESSDKVDYVQPNFCYETAAQDAPDPLLDPARSASYQYQIDAVGAEEAWDLLEQTEGHPRTIVGVVDTGVDSRHQDLQQNLLTLDENKTYRGFELGEETDLIDDTDAHGTHVTGIIGADFGNGTGGSGVASGHHNDLVKVITTAASYGDDLYTYDICRAIDYNVEQGARVINMSFGGTGEDVMLEQCIRRHYEEDQTVFVAASGNDSSNSYSTPCDYSTVIAVNASDRNGQAAYFSDYGKYKDLSAPGFHVMSTLPGDQYGLMSGTSMASPVVAGICGLVLDANPDLTPAQVKNILCATTKESQEGRSFDSELAYGNVDAAAAVEAAQKASAEVSVQTILMKEEEATEKTTLQQGESIGLTALVQPATSLAKLQWTSGDESIAAVDETGRVTALAEGKTEITASCGSQKASVLVQVKTSVPAESVSIAEKAQYEEGIPEDGIGQFLPEPSPDKAAIPGVTFTSSDPEVLFVDGPGYYVAKMPGTVTVQLLDAAGNLLDEMPVTVRQNVRQVTFTKKTSLLEVGTGFSFGAKAVDNDEQDGIAPYREEVTWEASNANGRIDQRGTFTAVKPGYCYVIARTDSGAYKACKVQIIKKSYRGEDYGLQAKKQTKQKVSLRWAALPCATKYQIQKKTAGGKWKTVKTVKKTKFTDKKFKKTSSYRVRAYYSKFGKTGWYGWSKTVKIKAGK